MRRANLLLLPLVLAALSSCASYPLDARVPRTRRLDPVVSHLPPARSLEQLRDLPLYELREKEVDLYLRDLSRRVADPLQRLVHLARKNLGQRYEIFCLGEYPFETYDPDPLYSLDRSDCVTFTEQMYAMALSKDWKGFFSLLQRIRYKDGEIGVASRNHYTEADWNVNNAWLFQDITGQLGGGTSSYVMRVDRSRMLKKQFGIETKIPVEDFITPYVPVSKLASAYPKLRDGDIIEVVKGKGDGRWIGHVGLFVRGAGGEAHFLHSSAPKVREESLPGYVKRMKGRVFGLKFLRLLRT